MHLVPLEKEKKWIIKWNQWEMKWGFKTQRRLIEKHLEKAAIEMFKQISLDVNITYIKNKF